MTKAVASVPIYYSASNIQVVDTYSEGVIIISKTILSLLSADNLYEVFINIFINVKFICFYVGRLDPGRVTQTIQIRLGWLNLDQHTDLYKNSLLYNSNIVQYNMQHIEHLLCWTLVFYAATQR